MLLQCPVCGPNPKRVGIDCCYVGVSRSRVGAVGRSLLGVSVHFFFSGITWQICMHSKGNLFQKRPNTENKGAIISSPHRRKQRSAISDYPFPFTKKNKKDAAASKVILFLNKIHCFECMVLVMCYKYNVCYEIFAFYRGKAIFAILFTHFDKRCTAKDKKSQLLCS